jgi:HK97 family phage portal protein
MSLFKSLFSPVSSKKSSSVGGLVAQFQVGKPVWTPKNYECLIREGYARNGIAYRCMRDIAVNVANVPFLLYQDGREIVDHPALSLLRHPNPAESQGLFWEGVVTSLLATGNAYLEMIGQAGRPSELWLLRADRMKVIVGEHGVPAGYEYTVGSKKKRWATDPTTGAGPIVHIKLPSPVNDWYGMGPLEVARDAIDQYNTACAWNQALLQNGCRPSGILTVDPDKNAAGSLSADQFQRLKDQFEENYTGAATAGRPLLLEGGLRWTDMMISPRDMDFLNMKHSAAREIALAFGYPPMLLGIPGDNTYSNQKEARLALWEQTILPLLVNLLAALEQSIIHLFDPTLVLSYDEDKISALSPRREDLWSRVSAADFLTETEKRQAVGYGEYQVTGDR